MIMPTLPLVWDCPICTNYNCGNCIDLINRIESEIYKLESKRMPKDETKTIQACKHCGYPVQSNVIHHCQVENARANEDWTLIKAKPVIGSSGEVVCTSTPAFDSDNVNHPKHYVDCDPVYEPINVIEAWKLGFNLGNAVKYIKRWNKKGGVEDLKKARWYLSREITNNEKSGQGK